MDLRELLSEHLWLVVWVVITLFSLFKRKKQEETGDEADGAPRGLEELRRLLDRGREEPPAARGPRLLARLEALVQRLQAIAIFAADDRRLSTLHAAVTEELLPRATELVRRIGADDEPIGAEYTVSKLERATSWLEVIVRQRSGDDAPGLRAGERVAALAAEPMQKFCTAQGIPYETRPFLAVRHGRRVERALRSEDLPFSLVSVSPEAPRDPRALALVAREVGEAIFFDVPELASSMAKGLSLPEALHLPPTARAMRPAYLRASFGPYLADLFADLFAVSTFGPAYGEALLHLARQPSVQKDAYRMQANERWISSHPPLALRFDFVCETLVYLGRVSDQSRLRRQWERLFEEKGEHYIFPAADGSAARIPREHVQGVVAAMTHAIIDFHHPALEGFRLFDIPGLGYLHGRHSAVSRSMRALAAGQVPREPPLQTVAAASLLAAEKPALAPTLSDLTFKSIRGEHSVAGRRLAEAGTQSQSLREMARDPRSLAQAVALGAALGRRPGARRAS